MRTKRLLIFVFTLVWSTWCLAQSARDLVLRDLSSQVKTFDREIRLFHYFNAPSDSQNAKSIHPGLSTRDERDTWLNTLVQLRAGVFWDFNNHSTALINAGPGMYFAIDPNSSRDFGNSAVILNVKAGTRFISVLKPIKLGADTLAALVKEKVINKSQLAAGEKTMGLGSGLYGAGLKNMVRSENSDFRKLLSDVFAELNIQFIEYLYQSHLAGFCKVANQSSFVFIGHAPAAPSEKDVLASIDDEYKNPLLLSDLSGVTRDESEAAETDKFMRFRSVLAQIRIVGTGASAKKLIFEKLQESEIQDLADRSYACQRKY